MTDRQQTELTIRAAQLAKTILGLVGMKHKDLVRAIMADAVQQLTEINTLVKNVDQ
tara:strand:+ start:8181 stop:8348 length:168 start_codon:yes stop_codon:yes gene_type:complete